MDLLEAAPALVHYLELAVLHYFNMVRWRIRDGAVIFLKLHNSLT